MKQQWTKHSNAANQKTKLILGTWQAIKGLPRLFNLTTHMRGRAVGHKFKRSSNKSTDCLQCA